MSGRFPGGLVQSIKSFVWNLHPKRLKSEERQVSGEVVFQGRMRKNSVSLVSVELCEAGWDLKKLNAKTTTCRFKWEHLIYSTSSIPILFIPLSFSLLLVQQNIKKTNTFSPLTSSYPSHLLPPCPSLTFIFPSPITFYLLYTLSSLFPVRSSAQAVWKTVKTRTPMPESSRNPTQHSLTSTTNLRYCLLLLSWWL